MVRQCDKNESFYNSFVIYTIEFFSIIGQEIWRAKCSSYVGSNGCKESWNIRYNWSEEMGGSYFIKILCQICLFQ